MDTTTVQNWLNSADSLLKSAQTTASSSQYGRAVETANAARGLIGAAEQLMRQALGANTLPSYTQRPAPGIGKGPGMGHKGGGFGDLGASGNITVTQAQASRVLVGLYSGIVAKDAQVKASSNSGDANNYLNAAKEYYRTAYDAYQAGKYNDAMKAASVGQTLLGVVESLLRAGVAPNNAETPVQVPAPNF
jgi:HEPN domain-containing protein